jgi:hypothetical protein
MIMDRLRCAALGAILALVTGCGTSTNTPEPEKLEMASVSGTVTLQGKSFGGPGYVVAVIAPTGRATMSALGRDGKFHGEAPVGPVKVSVMAEDEFMNVHGNPNPALENSKDATISAGSNQVDIELASAPRPPVPDGGTPQSSHSR